MLRSLIEPFTKLSGAACATLLCALALAAQPAAAEPRVALVIGNSAYKGDLPALPNPANDARLMAQSLKNVGFDVIEAEDADQLSMKKAIVEFGDKLTAAGSSATGLFFYAGHGVQVGGENYLIPVDAQIQKEADVDLAAVSATSVMKQMDFAGSAVNIVILDACRNNPLAASSRGMSRGLAEIASKPRGSFIAYSTSPGSTAADGDSANSPYTTALAETIQEPGVSIGDVFQEVRTKVLAATGNQQTPWDSSSLTGRFYFKPPEQTQTASLQPEQTQQPAVASTGSVAEDTALATEVEWWKSVKDSGDADSIQLYLDKYPNGNFVDDAKAKLAELKSTQVASVAPSAPAAAPSASGSIDHGTDQPVTTQEPARPATADPQVVAIIALDQTVYAKRDGRMRAAPDGKAELVTSFPPNTELTATGRTTDGRWWRIGLGNGQVGFMHTSVISEQPLQTAAMPQGQPQSPQVAADPNAVVMMDSGGGQSPAAANAMSAQQAQEIANAAQSPQSMGGQALSGLLSAAGQMLSGNGQALTAQSQDPRIVFAAYNHPITVRANAVIVDAPGNGAQVARVANATQMTAAARTSDGRWYQVLLPNGNYGYVSGNFVQR